MRIALVHNHYDEKHLAEVKEQMKVLGAPRIHAVWMEGMGLWAALEGCHRIRAAYELGLTPEIIEVEYSDELVQNAFPGCDIEDELTVSEVADRAYRTKSFLFDEEE